MRKVTAQSAVKFFKGLVCRFGVPNRVITDNGTQFTSHTFMQYIQDLGSKVCFASVAHPRSNGQVERANAEVLQGLGQRLLTSCARAEGAGLMNCRRFFGQLERHQIEPPARHPLPWYMGQKQFSPWNSYTGHLEYSLMTSLSKSNCGKMTQRSLRKIVFGRL